MRAHTKILRAFTAVILALLMVPVSAATVDPGQSPRASGDISTYVQVHDSDSGNPSYVEVKTAGGTPIRPDGNGDYSNVPDDAVVHIHYVFSLPDTNGLTDSDPSYEEYSYLAGDTFTLNLPQGLSYSTDGGSGTTKTINLGTWQLDTGSGTATLTFGDYVESHGKMAGTLDIYGKFTKQTTQNGDPVKIQFQSQVITITPQVSTPALGLTKQGQYDAAANTILWMVTVDPTQAGGSVSGVSMVDQYSPNQTYVAGSFKDSDSATGVETSVPDGDSALQFDGSTHKVTYAFPNAIDSVHTITYKTQPDSFSGETGTGSSTFGNTATAYVSGKQSGSPANASVTLDWISKSAGAYNYGTKEIPWTVKAGITDQTITGAMVKDSLPAGLTLDTGSVYWQAPGSSTKVLVTQDTGTPGSPALGKFGYDSSTGMLFYNAGTLTGQGILTYNTFVSDSDLNSQNIGFSYSNQAWLTWTEEGGSITDAPSATATGGVGSGGLISKSAGPTVNYNDGTTSTIHWTVTIDKNQINIDAGTVLEDDIPAGQQYVPGTFKFGGSAATPDSVVTDPGTGVTKIIYTLPAITGPTTVTYDTTITDKASLYSGNNNNKDVSFQNTAKLVNSGKSYDGASSTGTQGYHSQLVGKGVLTNYNYDTHVVTWQITVDRNNLSLTNAKVTDQIPAGMIYVDGSLTVDNAPAQPGPGSGSSVVNYTFAGTIQGLHTLTLQTKLTDDELKSAFSSKTYTNNVNLTSPEITSAASASAGSTIQNPIVTKAGAYSKDDDQIDWTVEVNKAKLSLGAGAALTDQLSNAIRLDTSTVQIYPAAVNPADGSLSKAAGVPLSADQYTVSYDVSQNVAVFTFKNPINSAYLLYFSTDVLPNTPAVNNSITLNGMGVSGTPTATVNGVQVNNMDATGSGETGSITIQKTDAGGKTLDGATFGLLDIAGNPVSGQTPQTTGADGSAKFQNLLYHTYYIKETSAPDGYLRSTVLQRVRLSATNRDYIYTAVDEKALGELSFAKTKEDGMTPLQGATFTLTDNSGKVPDRTAQSDSTGKVTFQNVPLGDYTIRETAAPQGWLISGMTLTANVKYNGDQTAVTTNLSSDTLTDSPAVGDFSFTKVKEDGTTPLAGAGFTLYDVGKNAVKTVFSDANGLVKFQNVPLGDYTVQETAVPAGYRAAAPLSVSVAYSADKTGVVITGSAVNATVVDNLSGGGNGGGHGGGGGTTPPASSGAASSSSAPQSSSAASSGSAVSSTSSSASSIASSTPGGVAGTVLTGPAALYIKKADKNGGALSGAEFTLFNADGKALQKKVTGSSGVIVFRNLPAGSYVVRETKAPAHYKLYSGELDVTLLSGQQSGYTLRDSLEGDDSGTLGWTSDGSLPKTGEFPIAPLVAVCGLLLIFTGVAVRRAGVRKKRMKHFHN